jgi:hypothetical protein
MDDRVSDSCLIDFSEFDLETLLNQDLKPFLDKAVRHVLASAHDSAYASFNASINSGE